MERRKMKCNNENCVWQAFDQCCPESEELYKNAIPGNECPSFLSRGHEEEIRLREEMK